MSNARKAEQYSGDNEPKISVVSANERNPNELVKSLFSLGTENIALIDKALKKMDYGALEDMVSESYFKPANETARGALAHLITDMKYAVDKESRNSVAQKIAESIENIGLDES
jgi:hypothetical protein